MSIRPIELQTNIAQKVNVDKLRQGELIHEQAEKAHISDVADEITRENLNVNETAAEDTENKIKDDQEDKNQEEQPSSNGNDEETEDQPEKDDSKDFTPKHEFEDPNKGKIVDIKL